MCCDGHTFKLSTRFFSAFVCLMVACIKSRDWIRVEKDCRKAIQLDHNSVKAHYMPGREDYPEGVKALQL
ncbi:unnamed protein product [Eruca vesicaria subsp. sativa]|uniref:Uncharacterized protein n=1 Tax=Eruca vesicaria subsp. sativa TaxID=29727 RepID=A0ABC8KTN7_ERUVS|nr:unnamed protein product [Eruca vesicaria subsp. sativa]